MKKQIKLLAIMTFLAGSSFLIAFMPFSAEASAYIPLENLESVCLEEELVIEVPPAIVCRAVDGNGTTIAVCYVCNCKKFLSYF